MEDAKTIGGDSEEAIPTKKIEINKVSCIFNVNIYIRNLIFLV